MVYLLGFLGISTVVLLWALWDIGRSPLGRPDEPD